MAESPMVLWFGRADRPWSQAALRQLLPVAQVQLMPWLDAGTKAAYVLPEVTDWLVLEEHRPGQVTQARLQPLLRKFPLAGLVVLQGPWSAGSYSSQPDKSPEVLRVAWHNWPWFVWRLQQPPAASPGGEEFSAPLVPLLGGCPQNLAPKDAFFPPAGSTSSCGDCWVLTGDVELGRMLTEQLQSLGASVRRVPPQVLLLPRPVSPQHTAQTVFGELSSWFPGHPRREIALLAHRLRPRRIVALAAQEWPDLPRHLQASPVETTLLPLPIPAGALARLLAWGEEQMASTRSGV